MALIQLIHIILGWVTFGTPGMYAATTVSPIRSMTLDLPETTSVSQWYLPITLPSGDNMTCAVTGDTKSLDYFTIYQRTCLLTLRRSLDTDPQHSIQYNVTVVANDQGNPSRTESLHITIRVSRNRNRPTFPQRFYNVTVPESLRVGSVVIKVTATDNDGESISYSLPTETATGDSSYFTILSTSGRIVLTQSLGKDTQEMYYMRVIATDSNPYPKSSSAIVTVTVTRTNQYAPVFNDHPKVVNVSEYTMILSAIGNVRATDADSQTTLGGQIRYTISRVNPAPEDSDLFIISPTNGDIILARPLADSALPDTFVLFITASDLSNTPKTATTQVTVNTIRNLHTPVFDKTEAVAYINGTDPVGKVIAVVTATDADALDPLTQDTPNAQITYRVLHGTGGPTRQFGITDDGRVFIKEPLASDIIGNYTIRLLLVAQDKSWNTKFSNMRLIVNVIQTATEMGEIGFIQPVYFVTLRENQPGDQIVFLQVTNQRNNRVRCQFVKNIREFALVTDRLNKNCILVRSRFSSIDRERTERYHIIVRVDVATLPRGKSAVGNTNSTWRQTEINIIVTDVNDNPPQFTYPEYPTTGYGLNKYFAAISTSAKPLDVVTKISASDRDDGPNGQVVIYINTTEQSYLPFHVSSDDGILSTTMEFDTSSPRHYRFTVHARDNPVDGDPRDSTTNVVVNLIDDHNRFVLVLKNKRTDEIISLYQDLRKLMQNIYGFLTLIETIQAKRTKHNSVDKASTDVVFVFVGNETDHGYRLLNNTDRYVKDRITSRDLQTTLRNQLNNTLNLDLEHVRLLYPQEKQQTRVGGGQDTIDCGFPRISSATKLSYALRYFIAAAFIAHAMAW